MRHAWVMVLSLAVLPAGAQAHGGGLDGYGCHHNRKQGGYHCHRGEFAGQSFKSQVEMLEKGKSKRKTDSQSKDKK